MKARPKILFLGICAGAHDDFRDWCQTGVLPNLRRLSANGLSGETRSVPALYEQCTWPAFYTGTGPAKQGIHSWQQLKSGTYDFYRAYTPENVRTTPFWDHLSAAGRRVAIFDIPHSAPSPTINGIQVAEWGAHDSNRGFATYPSSLGEELLSRFGHHPQRGSCDIQRATPELIEFRNRLVRGIEQKAAITRHYLAREEWDFFAQVFTEAHCMGHQGWHLHDPSHPRFNAGERALAGDPVHDVAVAIDRAIGEILEIVDESATVIVMASHGMTAHNLPQFMLPDILVRLGVARPSSGPLPSSAKRLLDPLLTWGWQNSPRFAQRWLEPLRHNARDLVRTAPPEAPTQLDAAGSHCFVINNNHTHGAIRVNLIGREPSGKIHPGAEYETFLDRLGHDLLDLTNQSTGNKIVKHVIRTSDLYSGEGTEHFPDLLVEWAGNEPVECVRSGKIGRLEKPYRYCRTGRHTPSGLFFAAGPDIRHGRIKREISILDFAPTFCESFGVTGQDFEGNPIREIVEALKFPRSR